MADRTAPLSATHPRYPARVRLPGDIGRGIICPVEMATETVGGLLIKAKRRAVRAQCIGADEAERLSKVSLELEGIEGQGGEYELDLDDRLEDVITPHQAPFQNATFRLAMAGTKREDSKAARTVMTSKRDTASVVSTGKDVELKMDMSVMALFSAGRIEYKLKKTVFSIFKACKAIAYKLRTDSADKKGTQNNFGDEQLSADIVADKIMFDQLKQCGYVACASSEEKPELIPMGGEGYSVAFDPLDGSSIIKTNFSVGTIFGVWPGNTLVGVTGRQLKAAGMAVYGPRTTLTLAIEGIEGSHEFLLMDERGVNNGSWQLKNSFRSIKEGRLFAPGNLRATNDNAGYAKLFQFWRENAYTLRYTGGMVPDVNQLLIKGKGIFVNPASKSHKAKLRLLYEAIPVAFVIEKAGGKSSDGEGSLLDVKVRSMDERTQVAYGSAAEVKRFEELVGKKFLSTL